MATMILNKLWLNRLDSGVAISANTSPDRSQAHSIDGDVETMAGGRQRAITTEGEKGQLGYILRGVSLATKDTLRAWKGLAVQVRDHRGQRFYAIITAVAVGEWKHRTDLYDVALTLRVITASDEV